MRYRLCYAIGFRDDNLIGDYNFEAADDVEARSKANAFINEMNDKQEAMVREGDRAWYDRGTYKFLNLQRVSVVTKEVEELSPVE